MITACLMLGNTNGGIVIEDGVFGRNTILSCKDGDII